MSDFYGAFWTAEMEKGEKLSFNIKGASMVLPLLEHFMYFFLLNSLGGRRTGLFSLLVAFNKTFLTRLLHP